MSDKLLTAVKARELSGPTVEEHCEHLLEQHVRPAAESGKRKTTVRNMPYAEWLYRKPKPGSVEAQTLDKLRSIGYTISFLYEERQFVDMGLVISWERKKQEANDE